MDNLSIFCIVLMIGWLATAVILMRTLGNSYTKDNLLKLRMDAIKELKRELFDYRIKEISLSEKHSETARNQTRDAKGRFVSSRTNDKIDHYKAYKESIMSNGLYLTKEELEEIRNSVHIDPYDESTSGWYVTLSEPKEKNIEDEFLYLGQDTATEIDDFRPNVEEFYDIYILDKDDDFILPKRWAVKITKENREALRAWAISQPDFDKGFDEWNCFRVGDFVVSKHPRFHSYQLMCSELNFDFTEITFEQFQKYVLNK